MSKPSSRSLRRLVHALLPVLAACSAPSAARENRAVLETAEKQLAAGQLDAARAPLEQLIVRTNATADQYVLQRYFAACLLVRSRLEASAQAGGDQWLMPLVASSYYMNFAKGWQQAASTAPAADEAGEAMLPASMAGKVEQTSSYLDLAWLILCARTRFLEQVGDILASEPKLATVEGAEKLSVSVGLSDELRPWLMWGLFEFQRQRPDSEPLAYTFGVRARELGRKAPKSFPAERSNQIVRWILEQSRYTFKSTAGIPFDPGAEVCSQTGEPNIKFHGTLKTKS